MKCDYNINNKCQLAKYFNWNISTFGDWCKDCCGPKVSDKLKMLRRIGVELPVPPDDTDLLEWAEQCIADGTAKLPPSVKEQRKRREQAEQERQRLLAQLPRGFQLAKNLNCHLKEIAAYYVKTGRIKVSDEHRDARRDKCRNCPDGKMVVDDNGVMRCALKSCGCYLDNPHGRPLLGGKAEYEALYCDIGHWDAIDRRFITGLNPV